MARLPIKGAPWLLVIHCALAARDHWGALEPADRAELARLLRTTRGRPSNLTVREKSELRRLVGKLDLPGLGKDLMPLATKRRRRH